MQAEQGHGTLEPEVTVVVISYNSSGVLPDLLRQLSGNVPVVVVDNGSIDGTIADVKAHYPAVQMIALGMNRGFGRANNVALERVETPFALLLNPDCVLQNDVIDALLAAAARYPDAAILAPMLYDAPDELGECFRPAFYHKRAASRTVPQGDLCSEFLTGAAMLLRMDAVRPLGFFDPWFFLYCEDDDLCERVRAAGHSLVLVHDARVLHKAQTSSRPSLRLDYLRAYCQAASKMYLLRKHVGVGAYRRLRRRTLSAALPAFLSAAITLNGRRIVRAVGRFVAACRAPRLLRWPHCID